MTAQPSGWGLSAHETIAAWEGAAPSVARLRRSSDRRVAGGGVDTELIARAQQGDHEAYTRLLETGLADRLLGVARWILRDVGLAEDAAQQALLAIWRDLPRLRDPLSFDAWAYRILVRACHAEGRNQRRWMPGIARTTPDPASRTDGLGWIADRDELESAFRRLSVDHRTIVVLRFYLDLPVERVAELLGVPGGTVQSRLHYAMRALRAALDADARTTPRQGRR